MKLESKAKPVKIRIKSGGEEHSSLDSLKHNFCVSDLIPLQKDGRLSRWLKQLNENELAEKIENIDIKELTQESYINFLKSFFEDLPDDISKICDFWLESSEYKNNGIRLLQYKLINDNNWNVDQIINLKDKYNKEIVVDWIDVVKKVIAECHDDNELFRIGKMFYEDKDVEYNKIGKELLEKLESKGNLEAVDFLESHCEITEDEIAKIKMLWKHFGTVNGLSYNAEKDLSEYRSIKAKATVEFLCCISNIMKGNKVIIHYKNSDIYFHDEMLFIEAMLKNTNTNQSFYPFATKKQLNDVSAVKYIEKPKILVQIENGRYGSFTRNSIFSLSHLSLSDILYDMAKYAVLKIW